jgi:hypothetical protein
MTFFPEPLVLSIDCLGDAIACRKGRIDGRPVHMYLPFDANEMTLVMPTYHFASIEDGVAIIKEWQTTARIIRTDADLNRARSAREPHYLPVGWIDPDRRR